MNNKINKEKILIRNGVWKSTGDNLFWINVIHNKVFWLGMNNRTTENELGENWCHVGNGTIIDNRIILDWSDISVGKGNLNGRIVIEMISNNKMKVIEDSGNFGMSTWNWETDQLNFSQIPKKEAKHFQPYPKSQGLVKHGESICGAKNR